MDEAPKIKSTDYWFKVAEFLQQNWGVIEETESGCTVYFFGDTADIFDQIDFNSATEAVAALKRNGFSRYDEDEKTQKFISKPEPTFRWQAYPNGPIYSSGRYWR